MEFLLQIKQDSPLYRNNKRKRLMPTRVTADGEEEARSPVEPGEVIRSYSPPDEASSESGSQCPECGEEFPDLLSVKLHYQSEHLKQEEELACAFCNKIFTTRDLLIKHVTVVHDGQEIFKEKQSHASLDSLSHKTSVLA